MRVNVPPLTRGLLVCLFVFTLLNWILRPGYNDWVQGVGKPLVSVGDGAPYLAIIPSTAIVYPWVFLVATVVEENIFGLLITGLTLFYGGRYLERAWSSAEFAKFILFISMIPNILTYLLYVIGYALSKNEEAMTNDDQDGNYLRRHCHPSRLPRLLQAARPRAHCLHRQRHHPHACETLPRHIPRRQYHFRHCAGHRDRDLPFLVRLLHLMDLPPLLPPVARTLVHLDRRRCLRPRRRVRHLLLRPLLPRAAANPGWLVRRPGLQRPSGHQSVHTLLERGHRCRQRAGNGTRRGWFAQSHEPRKGCQGRRSQRGGGAEESVGAEGPGSAVASGGQQAPAANRVRGVIRPVDTRRNDIRAGAPR
ncbi:hypothetical protein MPH_11785 [Macrophomina phaseolina MS6]|uniref:Uncharacterized protein n=1 Tax=Macrophomina phaseolina (strain MS6) TaxID=1126212 RepID=K2RE32_MACPH|nr:hypothetical protein MPH_11785 [Macrophomina phaseolina MS6]